MAFLVSLKEEKNKFFGNKWLLSFKQLG